MCRDLGFTFLGIGFRFYRFLGLGLRVLRFRVYVLRFGVQGFRAWSLGSKDSQASSGTARSKGHGSPLASDLQVRRVVSRAVAQTCNGSHKSHDSNDRNSSNDNNVYNHGSKEEEQ